MKKQTYTQELLDTLLQKSIVMDHIDSLSESPGEFTELDSISLMLDRSNSELLSIDIDFGY